jgi:mono/diheme cytochrome c family protein
MKLFPLATLGVALLSVLAACASLTKPSASDRYFIEQVKPVFEAHCLRCHSGELPAAGLNLSNGARAMASHRATGGQFIVPGKVEASYLLRAIARNGTHPKLMPRADLSLTDDQIGALTEWIEDGAHWPSGPTGELHHVATGENR